MKLPQTLAPLGSRSWLLPALILTACAVPDGGPKEESVDAAREAMLARALELDLGGEWALPPNEPIVNHTSGFAKVLCSNVFFSGLDPKFAAEHTGGFSSPFDQRGTVTDTVVDMEARSVSLTLPNGVVRTAKMYGSQGCVTQPLGFDSVFFTPSIVEARVPDPMTTPWPMGELIPDAPLPGEVNGAKLEEAVDAAFEGDGLTAAFVVTYKGQLVAEGYREGIDEHTPLESWSMGKSLSATLLGILMERGVYDLWEPAPIPEWRTSANDPRQAIRIADILRMSSGLRFRAPLDPDFDPDVGYPDHLYVYTGPNAFEWAANKPLQWNPGTVGRYRNSDPVLTNYLIRLGVEGLGENYHAFPQRALFDKLGIDGLHPEVDPHGNFLLQGYEFGTGRDWARIGNLYLQDGLWEGERILPEGYANFVSTLAPGWKADGRNIYGGLFWINGDGGFPIPTDVYYMAGAGGQFTFMIPSHDMVVVRLGHYSGADAGAESLANTLTLLMEAVPAIDRNWRASLTSIPSEPPVAQP